MDGDRRSGGRYLDIRAASCPEGETLDWGWPLTYGSNQFALTTPCTHAPECYSGPSKFKSRVAYPWSWGFGSSTSAAQTSLSMIRSRWKARPFGREPPGCPAHPCADSRLLKRPDRPCAWFPKPRPVATSGSGFTIETRSESATSITGASQCGIVCGSARNQGLLPTMDIAQQISPISQDQSPPKIANFHQASVTLLHCRS